MADGRDWTVVLDAPCPECGEDVRGIADAEIAARIRAAARRWSRLLDSAAGDPAAARARPADDVWSTLEYAAHVRDVFALFDHRVGRMLTEDDPEFADWDPDRTAMAEDYRSQQVDDVARRLAGSSAALAKTYAGVTPAEFARPGRRSDGARFTVGSIGQYMLHDVLHHLWDVTKPPPPAATPPPAAPPSPNAGAK